MTRQVSFVGPAAAGLAPGAESTAADLLDLFDERIYLTRWPDDPYEAQFAGIAALMACCGAWPEEIPWIETADIKVKNVPEGANLDPADPADNGIWLGQGDLRRRVWVPEIVRKTLVRVAGRVTPSPGCTRLFKRRDGKPLIRLDIINKFESLCRRVGTGRYGLPGRLLALLHERLPEGADDLAAAFLTRHAAAMRSARAPLGEGEPDLVRMRKTFESSDHPLRTLTRDILQHVRPIERRYPDRAFRGLSPQTVAGVAAVRADPKRHCYPPAFVDAIVAARDAGRHDYEIAHHYGIPVRSVEHLVRNAEQPTSAWRTGMGPLSHQEIFLNHARRHPEKTLRQIRDWMEQRFGIVVIPINLYRLARKEGLTFGRSRGYFQGRRDRQRLEAHIRKHPEQTVVDVKAWARDVLGCDAPTTAIAKFADSRGLQLTSCFKLRKSDAAKLEVHAKANPDIDAHELVGWIERELGATADVEWARNFLRRRGLKLRKSDQSVKTPHGRVLLAWLQANPEFEFNEALAWLEAEHGVRLRPGTLRSFLAFHGVKLLSKKQGGRQAPYGPAVLAWIDANPGREFAEALAWLKTEHGLTVNPATLYSFLKDRGIRLPNPRKSAKTNS
jgi:transposase